MAVPAVKDHDPLRSSGESAAGAIKKTGRTCQQLPGRIVQPAESGHPQRPPQRCLKTKTGKLAKRDVHHDGAPGCIDDVGTCSETLVGAGHPVARGQPLAAWLSGTLCGRTEAGAVEFLMPKANVRPPAESPRLAASHEAARVNLRRFGQLPVDPQPLGAGRDMHRLALLHRALQGRSSAPADSAVVPRWITRFNGRAPYVLS